MKIFSIILTLFTINAQAIQCENQANQLLQKWGLGTIASPKETRTEGSKDGHRWIQIGSRTKFEGKQFPENKAIGGVYQSMVSIMEIKPQTRVKRSGYVSKDGKPYRTDVIEVVLDENCKLSRVIYPNSLEVSAKQCEEISKIKADGEVLRGEIMKVLKENPEYQVEQYSLPNPLDSITANCRGKSAIFAQLLNPVKKEEHKTALQKRVEEKEEWAERYEKGMNDARKGK